MSDPPGNHDSNRDPEQKGMHRGMSSLREAGRYLHLGLEFLGAIILFVGAGFLVDRWLGLLPLFTLLGVVLAFAAIITQVLRFSKTESSRRQTPRRSGGSEQ